MMLLLGLISSLLQQTQSFSPSLPKIAVSARQSAPRRTLASHLSMTASAIQTVDLKTTIFNEQVESEAPPVLLLHGLLGSKRNFSTIGASLAAQLKTKRRIVAVDLRNHGENTHDLREEMSYTEMAHDVLGVMDKHGMDKCVLVGHSVGGKVSQALSLLYPERVAGLVVLDIAPVQYTTDEPHWQAVHDIVTSMTKIPEGLDKKQVDVMLQDAVPDPALRAFLLTNYQSKWKIPMDSIQRQLETLAGFDIPQHYEYTGDVFFIHGGQSRFVRSGHMESIQNYFPNHMLTTVRGAGHWVHAEAPDATVALLKRYLDR